MNKFFYQNCWFFFKVGWRISLVIEQTVIMWRYIYIWLLLLVFLVLDYRYIIDCSKVVNNNFVTTVFQLPRSFNFLYKRDELIIISRRFLSFLVLSVVPIVWLCFETLGIQVQNGVFNLRGCNVKYYVRRKEIRCCFCLFSFIGLMITQQESSDLNIIVIFYILELKTLTLTSMFEFATDSVKDVLNCLTSAQISTVKVFREQLIKPIRNVIVQSQISISQMCKNISLAVNIINEYCIIIRTKAQHLDTAAFTVAGTRFFANIYNSVIILENEIIFKALSKTFKQVVWEKDVLWVSLSERLLLNDFHQNFHLIDRNAIIGDINFNVIQIRMDDADIPNTVVAIPDASPHPVAVGPNFNPDISVGPEAPIQIRMDDADIPDTSINPSPSIPIPNTVVAIPDASPHPVAVGPNFNPDISVGPEAPIQIRMDDADIPDTSINPSPSIPIPNTVVAIPDASPHPVAVGPNALTITIPKFNPHISVGPEAPIQIRMNDADIPDTSINPFPNNAPKPPRIPFPKAVVPDVGPHPVIIAGPNVGEPIDPEMIPKMDNSSGWWVVLGFGFVVVVVSVTLYYYDVSNDEQYKYVGELFDEYLKAQLEKIPS